MAGSKFQRSFYFLKCLSKKSRVYLKGEKFVVFALGYPDQDVS